MHELKYSKRDHKIHFTLGVKSYVFLQGVYEQQTTISRNPISGAGHTHFHHKNWQS